jgi:hypothetical protein
MSVNGPPIAPISSKTHKIGTYALVETLSITWNRNNLSGLNAWLGGRSKVASQIWGALKTENSVVEIFYFDPKKGVYINP